MGAASLGAAKDNAPHRWRGALVEVGLPRLSRSERERAFSLGAKRCARAQEGERDRERVAGRVAAPASDHRLGPGRAEALHPIGCLGKLAPDGPQKAGTGIALALERLVQEAGSGGIAAAVERAAELVSTRGRLAVVPAGLRRGRRGRVRCGLHR